MPGDNNAIALRYVASLAITSKWWNDERTPDNTATSRSCGTEKGECHREVTQHPKEDGQWLLLRTQ